MWKWVDKLGEAFIGLLHYVLKLFGLLYLSFKVVWTDRDLGQRDFLRQVMLQVYYTGVQSILPVVVIALMVGGFSIVKGIGGIGTLSGADNLGRLLTVIVLREVAPLITGGVIITRSVTAISAELGVMRVQREIEALEVMGISPIRQLVTPRIFGGVLALLSLNIVFGCVSLGGGYALTRSLVSVPASVFLHSVLSAVTPGDIVVFSVKILGTGIGLFVIACYHGMSVMRASTEVPIAVSRASLDSLVFLFVFQLALSATLLVDSSAVAMIGGVL
ncbi:MAG: ABC transporter permease [Myxococcota bacterium]|jgi:phospholipid/cholesterol/gamma-HCH transport system permease protein|nr:ABC transporter permease [Myxococcota bacterium]